MWWLCVALLSGEPNTCISHRPSYQECRIAFSEWAVTAQLWAKRQHAAVVLKGGCQGSRIDGWHDRLPELDNELRYFLISAGPVCNNLTDWSVQAGWGLACNLEGAQTQISAGLKGYWTPFAALNHLLEGTTLRYAVVRSYRDADHPYLISARAKP